MLRFVGAMLSERISVPLLTCRAALVDGEESRMSARAIGVVVLVCAALGLGGCNAAPEPRWAMPTETSPSPTAAASPTPSVDRSALQEKAKAATIAHKGMAGIGVSTTPKEDKAVGYALTTACGKQVDADQNGVHLAYNRTWSAQGWWVSNTVHAYGTATGAEVVGQAKAAVESCKTYAASDGTHTLLGAVQLPGYPGVEASYGYCQSIKRTDATYVSCLAFLARGNLVSSLWIVRGSTQQTNSNGLIQVGSVAAEALRKTP